MICSYFLRVVNQLWWVNRALQSISITRRVRIDTVANTSQVGSMYDELDTSFFLSCCGKFQRMFHSSISFEFESQ